MRAIEPVLLPLGLQQDASESIDQPLRADLLVELIRNHCVRKPHGEVSEKDKGERDFWFLFRALNGQCTRVVWMESMAAGWAGAHG